MDLKVSLEQWRALLAVVDAGGYAAAAEALDKNQTNVKVLQHKGVKKLKEILVEARQLPIAAETHLGDGD